MRFLTTIGFALALSACVSSSQRPDASPATIENLVLLEAHVAYAPRRAQEIENLTLHSPKIQNCLRLASDIRENSFQVGVEGHLNYRGETENVTVTAGGPNLKACLAREMAGIRFGRGRMGPFKMRILRGKPPEDPSQKPKGVLLDLTAVKKWS